MRLPSRFWPVAMLCGAAWFAMSTAEVWAGPHGGGGHGGGGHGGGGHGGFSGGRGFGGGGFGHSGGGHSSFGGGGLSHSVTHSFGGHMPSFAGGGRSSISSHVPSATGHAYSPSYHGLGSSSFAAHGGAAPSMHAAPRAVAPGASSQARAFPPAATRSGALGNLRHGTGIANHSGPAMTHNGSAAPHGGNAAYGHLGSHVGSGIAGVSGRTFTPTITRSGPGTVHGAIAQNASRSYAAATGSAFGRTGAVHGGAAHGGIVHGHGGVGTGFGKGVHGSFAHFGTHSGFNHFGHYGVHGVGFGGRFGAGCVPYCNFWSSPWCGGFGAWGCLGSLCTWGNACWGNGWWGGSCFASPWWNWGSLVSACFAPVYYGGCFDPWWSVYAPLTVFDAAYGPVDQVVVEDAPVVVPDNQVVPPVQPQQAPLPAQPERLPPPESTRPEPAQVNFILPDPHARIWVNDFATASTGPERLFETPVLQPRKIYTYRLTVLWQQDGQTMRDERKLDVAAGGTVTVDYTKPQVAAN